MSPRQDPDKTDWADHADTTLAHNRGTQGDAQLKAENRTLPTGLPRTVRPDGSVEVAMRPPAPERATGGPQRDAPKRAGEAEPDLTPAEDRPVDLASLTKKELLARAKAADIDVPSSATKADIIAALS